MDVMQRLAQSGTDGVRMAIAESLTSGQLCAEVGKAGHASTWFAGGVVAYLTSVKEELLGVSAGTDPCSGRCAEELSAGVRTLLHADVAVSTTGVGGPSPVDGHQPGTVYLGWASPQGRGHKLLRLDGGPDQVVEAAVTAGLNLLAAVAEGAHQRPQGTPG